MNIPIDVSERKFSTAPITLEPDSVDHLLLNIGQMIGLLINNNGKYVLNDQWFANPLQQTSDGFKNNSEQLPAILSELMGELSGTALGIPVKDPGLLGSWYPIKNPSNGELTGLNIVNYAQGKEQVFGFGVRHNWVVDLPSADIGPDKIVTSVYGLIPLIKVGPNGLGIVIGQAGAPITLGAMVDSGENPMINFGGFSLDGFKVTADINFNSSDPFNLAIEVIQLKLPSESKPQDRSLSDLAQLSGQQYLETAVSLFMSALARISNQSDKGKYLLAVIGLSDRVDGTDLRVPTLDWIAMASDISKGGTLPKPVIDWFNALLSDKAALENWLTCISGLVGNPTPDITGDGSRENPYAISIYTVDTIGTLDFTIGSLVEKSGVRHLYPGLHFSSIGFKPASSVDIALRIVSDLELAEFVLNEGDVDYEGPSSLSFTTGITLANEDTSKPMLDFDGYTFGSLQGGVSLAGDLSVIPAFELVNVVTPNSQYDRIVLTDPNKLADIAESELYLAIDKAISNLLGLEDNNSFGRDVATLVGFKAPASLPVGVAWPFELPLEAKNLTSAITDPVQAIGRYYQAVLTGAALSNGDTAFTYIIEGLAKILQQYKPQSLPKISVIGQGTPSEPWQVQLADSSLPVSLQVWQVQTATNINLYFGLSVQPTITLGSTELVPNIQLTVCCLTFAKSGDLSIDTQWLPQVSSGIELPKPFATPPVFDSQFKVDKAGLKVMCSSAAGWQWDFTAQKPTVVINGKDYKLADSLSIDNPTQLKDLVLKQAANFAPALLGIIGLAIYRNGSRMALAADGIAGLLPNIGSAMPEGVNWPNNMPLLKLPNFDDPVAALKIQLDAIFAIGSNATAALGLLAWAIDSKQSNAPAINGDGTFSSPWVMPTPTPLDALGWYDNGHLGLGAQFLLNKTVSNIEIDNRVMLKARAVALSGSTVAANITPTFDFSSHIKNKSGALIDNSTLKLSIGSVDLGCVVEYANGGLQFTPVLTFSDVNFGDLTSATVTWEDFASASKSEYALILDEGINSLCQQLKGNDSFNKVYTLLTQMGLVLKVDAENTRYGIQASGWRALTANPLTFVSQGLLNVLADTTARDNLFALMEEITGITLPTLPPAVLETLAALEFLQSKDLGYAINMPVVLQFCQAPISTLENQCKALLSDAERVKQLLSELKTLNKPVSFGPFTMTLTNNGSITVTIDKNIALGQLFELSGSVTFDLAQQKLVLDTRFYNQSINLALTPELTLSLPVGTQNFSANFAVLVAWGDGSLPSAQSLAIYPFDKNVFINQVAELAPVYALSSFVTGTIENQLLADYSAAQVILGGIGMAYQDDSGKWLMPALNGLITDPKGWLLSNSVLGKDGQFDLGTLGRVLSNIPEVKASSGIGFKKITGGAQLYGLPYGIHINVTADSTQATFSSGISGFAIAGGKANIENLNLGIALNASYQPSITGDISVSGDQSLPIKVNAGYNKQFALSIAQTSTNGISLVLMPFPGWEPLVKQIVNATAQKLLPRLTDILLTKLEAKHTELKPFITKLRTVSCELDVQKLLSDITNAISNPGQQSVADAVAAAALGWLKDLFDDTNVSQTTDAITAIFTGVISGVTAEKGLISYTPKIDSLPITLLVGKNTLSKVEQLGIWVQVHAPTSSLLSFGISPTGVGVGLSDGSIQYNLALEVNAPIGLDCGPALNFGYEAARKNLVLSFDPLGDNSTLKRELYPQFFPPTTSANLGSAILDWLGLVVTQVLPRYISIAVLNTSAVSKWLSDPLFTDGPSAADLLVASQVLVKESLGVKTQYVLNTLSNLQTIEPEAFIANFLKTLLEKQVKVLPIPDGGVFLGKVGDKYGIRAQIPNIKLGSTTIQLGAKDGGWIKRAGGPDLDSGISIYLPINETPEFDKLSVNFVNVGLDLNGKGNANLISLSRFNLKSIEPRILLTLDFGQSSIVTFGAGAVAEGIAISLAPNTEASGDGGNPVAANVLGSGASAAKPSDSKDNPSVNPAFSVRAGYVSELSVELLNMDGDAAEKVWVPVQRSFGPVHANKIGIGWEQTDMLLDVLFDGSIGLAGLLVELQELSVGIPVEHPTDYSQYHLDLQGLDISYNGGAVEMTAGLLRSQDKPTDPIIYTGQASLKASTFSLSAIGSYAEVTDAAGKSEPSLFVFGQLQTPLGGVPAFFVNGVAAGFSYNRDLTLPDITGVQTFPLVQVGNFTSNDPGDALAQLNDVVKPRIGEYWVAAGVQATSFELIDTQALLFVKFGRTFEIDIIGLSTLALPKSLNKKQNKDLSTKLAYAELAIKASFRPDDGVVSVEAQLTPNSFILDKSCRLTGGFAFYLWYKGEHKGQFVISLGGYNLAFQKPDFYPKVPRVGFSWTISSEVSIKGGTYFAMTPIAIMAGGDLHATFSAGPIKAWFDAGADFMIAWEPFYFQANINVVVGASFTVKLVGVKATISAQIGAGLAIWGPPTGGAVKVDWTVISFSIPFGSKLNTASDKPLSWGAFEQQFLPSDGKVVTRSDENGLASDKLSATSGEEDASADETNVIKFNYGEGLVPADSKNPDDGIIKLTSGRFSIDLNSVIPFTTLTALEGSTSTGKAMGIRPMHNNKVESEGTVSLSFFDGLKYVPVELSETTLDIVDLIDGASGALWSDKDFDPDQLPDPDSMVIKKALMGVSIVAHRPKYLNEIGPFDILKAFDTESIGPLNLPFDNTPNYQPGSPPAQKNQLQTIHDTLMSEAVITMRNQYLNALSDAGFVAPSNPDLTIMAAYVKDILVAPPVLAAPGQYLPVSTGSFKVVASAAPELLQNKPLEAPILLAATNRYKTGSASNSSTDTLVRRDSTTASHCLQCTRTLKHMVQVQGGARSAILHPGGSQIWRLDENHGKHELGVKGQSPVRVSFYGKHHHLLDHAVHQPGTLMTLPQGTTTVVVKALSYPACDNALVGWLSSSNVLKLNPYYYQSGDVLIRPQCASPIREFGQRVKLGYISAATVMKENLIRNEHDEAQSGWVETLMPSYVRTVAVLMKGSNPRRALSYAFKVEPESVMEYTSLEAEESILLSDAQALLYNIPLTCDSTPYLSIQTQPEQGTELLGVLGSELSEQNLKTRWDNQYLFQHSIDLEDDLSEIKGTCITVNSAKEQ
ncbi:hypothetical protein PSECIP111854_03972 [Pseudoalteromonas sp. CIP111854]|uniref:DUF6603 domain-containing protein n=1 Tax=Pseudoalteromonas holothuriae TaxID=2963714 RepID=A0A9W4W3H1_9GAMM|nr:DUF6603 domain-containing protein [Pseudoalteromonas sp. CIP111854]CAH9066854.1 hypothetical protein PSECIP111854_03972 [Pseudoalteromonas sp. CIP111854]